MSDLRKIIEHVLKDVHIETGRKDEYEKVVDELEAAISEQYQLDLEQANEKIKTITAAFNDRVKIIEMQLNDIQVLAEALHDALTEILRPTISRERYKEILELANKYKDKV